jgi:hypothetical protein
MSKLDENWLSCDYFKKYRYFGWVEKPCGWLSREPEYRFGPHPWNCDESFKAETEESENRSMHWIRRQCRHSVLVQAQRGIVVAVNVEGEGGGGGWRGWWKDDKDGGTPDVDGGSGAGE